MIEEIKRSTVEDLTRAYVLSYYKHYKIVQLPMFIGGMWRLKVQKKGVNNV